jgi:hypothetical protein
MSQSFAVDARIPVSKDISQKDPAHPSNVIRGLLEVQNQATADTKYDAMPPTRIYESFRSKSQYDINTYLIIFGVALFILYGVYISTMNSGANSKQSFRFFFFVLIVVGVLLFATQFIRI